MGHERIRMHAGQLHRRHVGLVGNAGCAPTVVCFLDPGENWTVRWDTSGANRSETIYMMVADNLTPGTHCIWYEGGYAKEFEFV